MQVPSQPPRPSAQPRIDFHSNVSDQLLYTCRLIRKALSTPCKVVVRHQDEQQQVALNQLLWRFSEVDFLPHVLLDMDGNHPLAHHTPVLLSVLDQPVRLHQHAHQQAQTHAQTLILINLGTSAPSGINRYDRLIEIVPVDPQAIDAGRTRYRFYQKNGYPLTHITAK